MCASGIKETNSVTQITIHTKNQNVFGLFRSIGIFRTLLVCVWKTVGNRILHFNRLFFTLIFTPLDEFLHDGGFVVHSVFSV